MGNDKNQDKYELLQEFRRIMEKMVGFERKLIKTGFGPEPERSLKERMQGAKK